MEGILSETAARNPVASLAGRTATVHCEAVELTTQEAPSFVDITDEVSAAVAASRVRFGQVNIFSTHTTAAIKINEKEPLLLTDLTRALCQLAPIDAYYEHNDFSRRTVNMDEDECQNGHAHCQHLFLSASETVPIVDGQLTLGQWQRIFLVELDRPRRRRVLISVIGVSAASPS
jgi:secondary thiamine-phosphate synthase enzyme